MTIAGDRLTQALADRYRIERELGAGGMATVYLAADLKHDRQVAIKVLRPELSAVIGAERFLREIKTIAGLQHPHILGLIDSGQLDGTAFYVMPFVEGESLRDRLNREKQLPINDAVRIATEVASALDYAHRHGVIHRDIKPENILLHDGQALVADFGIALAVSTAGGSRMTETGMSLGTPHYMSPEQAMGEREITARSDVYALGAVTYEMLTGDPPFTGSTAQAIVAKVVTEKPVPPSRQRETVPAGVEDAVLTALQKLPADRFESAAAFAQALRDTSSTTMRVAAGRGRDRAIPRLAWIVVAAGIAVGALLGWLARRPAVTERPRVRVVLSPDSAAPAAALDCCAPAVAISPDGRRFVYTSRRTGYPTLFLRDRDGFAPQMLADGGRHPIFSPDGERVAFVAGSGSSISARPILVVGPIGGSAWGTVTALPTQNLTGAAWTASGTIVLGEYQAWLGLMQVAIEGGTPEPLTVPDTAAGEERHVAPHFVPEANGILFTIWMRDNSPASARIGFVSLADRKVRVLGPGLGPQYTRAGYLLSSTPQGVLTAQKMDLGNGKSSGAPIRIADSVSVRSNWTVDYAVSQGGTLVFDQGHTVPSVELVSRDGVARPVPIAVDNVRHWDTPRFSPDGRFVAAAGSLSGLHQVFILDLERGTGLRLTLEGNTEFLDWSADGRTLVTVKENTQLAEQALDRSGAERVLWPGDGRIIGRISVHGPRIAFARTAGGAAPTGSDIFVFHRDSMAPYGFLTTRFGETAPTISPDGRWLAYVSDETGRREVYLAAFPEAAQGRRVISTEGAGEPQWSRDGRTLYYRTASGTIVAHDIRSTPLTIGPPRQLFTGTWDISDESADYDIHPSGDRFVMMTSRSIGSRLVWVLNGVPAQ